MPASHVQWSLVWRRNSSRHTSRVSHGDGRPEARGPERDVERSIRSSRSSRIPRPIGRMAEPEEIASLCVYLCSDEASFVTGAAWPIDGGFMNVRL